MSTLPQNALVYTRISDARMESNDGPDENKRSRRTGTAGVTDQAHRCRELADRLGWECGPSETHVIVENDTSAFKRRKIVLPDGQRAMRVVRPGWRKMLTMLSEGKADGLVALDLDRCARDPRDLEDLIDVVETRSVRIPVESVTGSLRLSNDADITMARVMVAVANKSSRDTARRVAAARRRDAVAGKYGGGQRPFGYERDGVTIRPNEAAEVVNTADAVLVGLSLRMIAANLRERGVPTVTGAAWSPGTVRDILLRPRNAGIAVYRGEEVGKGQWPAILSEPTWRAVVAFLSDPARRTSPGNTPRWLGSLIYRCGVCGDVVSQGGGRHHQPAYTCRGPQNHLRRAAHPVDEFVSRVMIARLEQPDAASLLSRRNDIDTAALSKAANEARQRMTTLARLYGAGKIDARQLEDGTEHARVDLKHAEDALADAAPSDLLAGMAGRADAAAIWDALDIGHRREIVRLLVDVTLLPGIGGRRPGGSYFDPQTVRITWKKPGASQGSHKQHLRAVR